MLIGFVENKKFRKKNRKKKMIFTISPDILYLAKLLAGYQAAGYPAKSVSGTTLIKIKQKPTISGTFSRSWDIGF